MREVTIDITPFEEKIPLHRYLKETLDFPFYYGANLDALHDELASQTRPTRITVLYAAHPRGRMVDYQPKLLRLFHDVSRENYNLEFVYEERE
ncbi:MAG TPA: barstar family protein [Candidatus Limiplasma stercoravium]|nr:barstar family protein [Candidatus Limiplasma stercoravium]